MWCCNAVLNLGARLVSLCWLTAFAAFVAFPAHAVVNVPLIWNPSADANVAGYKIYYGTVSHAYTSSVNVGNVTNTVISGLSDNTTYYFAATTYNSSGVESDFSNEALYQSKTNSTVTIPPPASYEPPTLNPIGNISINENAGLQTVSLTGITLGSGQTLTLSAVSSDPSLIPNPAISYTSPASSGSLSFAPVSNKYGTAVITVTANNGQAQSNIVTRAFTVTVAPVYQPPTMDTIQNVNLSYGTSTKTITVTGVTAGSGNDNRMVTVAAVSSNPQLIVNPQAKFNIRNHTANLVIDPVLDANGNSLITVTVNNGQPQNNIVTRTFMITVATNQPPTADPIADVTLAYGTKSANVSMSGISVGAADEKQKLSITAVSSDPTVIPNPRASYNSRNGTGVLTLKPVSNTSGTATITVTFDDGQPQNHSVTRTFTVTVKPNQPPTLDPIADVTLAYDSKPQNIALSGISTGSPDEKQKLTITATSSDPSVVADARGRYNSRDGSGTLTLKTIRDASGTAVMTVTVDDGQPEHNTVIRTFTVTVKPNQPPTLDPIASVTLAYDSKPQNIALTGITDGSTEENQHVKLTAVSSNPDVIPDPHGKCNLKTGVGTLTLKPLKETSGASFITVTLDDGQPEHNLVTRTFLVTVEPNMAPTMDPIPDMIVPYGFQSTNIDMTGISVGSPGENQKLKITAFSSDLGLVSNPTIKYNSQYGTGTLGLKFHPNTNGIAYITVVLDDGSISNNITTRKFAVTIAPEMNSAVASKTTVKTNVSALPAALLSPINSNGTFSFQVDGSSGSKYAVEVSTDLVNWTSVETNTAPFVFEDVDASQHAQRFYRAVTVNVPTP